MTATKRDQLTGYGELAMQEIKEFTLFLGLLLALLKPYQLSSYRVSFTDTEWASISCCFSNIFPFRYFVLREFQIRLLYRLSQENNDYVLTLSTDGMCFLWQPSWISWSAGGRSGTEKSSALLSSLKIWQAEGLGVVTSSYSERSDLWRTLATLYSRPRPLSKPDPCKIQHGLRSKRIPRNC